jgi:hypothetical protein
MKLLRRTTRGQSIITLEHGKNALGSMASLKPAFIHHPDTSASCLKPFVQLAAIRTSYILTFRVAFFSIPDNLPRESRTIAGWMDRRPRGSKSLSDLST